SKIIDEMDVFDVKLKSIQFFKNDERELWSKLPKIHNYYLRQGIGTGLGQLPEDGSFKVDAKFEEPVPIKERIDVLAEIEKEKALGLSTAEMQVRKANPTATDEQVRQILEENNQSKPETIEVEDDGESTEGDNPDTKDLRPKGAPGDSE